MKRRGRGDGSIRQRRTGLWEASLRYKDPITELPQRISYYGPTRAAVVDKLDAARRRLRGRNRPGDRAVRLSEWLNHWLDVVVRPNLRASTVRSYELASKTIAATPLGSLALTQLREAQVAAVLAAGTPTRTRQLALVVLKRSLTHAVRYGLLERNPAAGVAVPRRARRELRALSAEQVRAFLDVARADRLFALYYLAIDTGLRQGELLALQWSDVNLDRGELRVVRARDNHTGAIGPVKTASGRRTIALGARAVAVLRAHRDGSPCKTELVFTCRAGGTLSPQNLRNRSFLPLQKAAGIDPPVRFHDLRHTAASLLLEAGVHPKIVSERLGHASIAITMDTYQHVVPSLQRVAADSVSRLIGGIGGGTDAGRAERGGARKSGKPR